MYRGIVVVLYVTGANITVVLKFSRMIFNEYIMYLDASIVTKKISCKIQKKISVKLQNVFNFFYGNVCVFEEILLWFYLLL